MSAVRSVNFASFTPTAVADTAAIVDGTHISVQGNSGTQRVLINEIFCGGQAPSASSPMYMVFARHSTVGVTLSLSTNAKDAVTDASAPAGTAQGYTVATTDPQRSSTLGLLNLSFNAFGGIVRWQSPQIPGKEITIVGNTASLGEAGLSQFTGGTAALIGAYILYEPL